MMDFLKNHILHTKTLTIVAGLVALAAFIAAGYILFSMPQEAEAQSCRMVSAGVDLEADASVSKSSGESGTSRNDEESVSESINFSSYANSDEYVSEISFSASADVTYCQGTAQCIVAVGGNIGDYGEPGIRIDDDNINDGASDSGSFSVNVPEGDSSVDFHAFAHTKITFSSEIEHGGFSASSGLSNVQLTICENPNNPPNAANDGSTSDRIPVPYGQVREINVLDNDSDPDNDSLSISSATTNSSQSSASPSSGQVSYNPGSLNSGDTDRITYSISDGNGGTDSAYAYVRIESEVSGVEVIAPDYVSHNAYFDADDDGSFESSEKYGQQSGYGGYNVSLTKNSKTFKIDKSDVSADSTYGYELPDTGWINKDVPVSDKTGSDNTAELGQTYTEYDPEASFTYSPSSPNHGDTVTFDASGSSDQDGSISSYSWSFGDGGSGSGETYSRSFSMDGSYSAQSFSVNLDITDNDGHSDSSSDTVRVSSQDSDGDGVYDRNDSCTYSYGEGSDGCPIDSDGDGVYNHDDSCPYNYGEGSDGCPTDSDGDGVYDKNDSCPDTYGTLASGCPDDGGGDPDDPIQIEEQR